MNGYYNSKWYYNIMKISPKHDNRPKRLLYKINVFHVNDTHSMPTEDKKNENIKI